MSINLSGAIAYNTLAYAASRFTGEHIVKLVHFWQTHNELAPDGEAGPKTQASLDVYSLVDKDKPAAPSDLDVTLTCVVEDLGRGRYRVRAG